MEMMMSELQVWNERRKQDKQEGSHLKEGDQLHEFYTNTQSFTPENSLRIDRAYLSHPPSLNAKIQTSIHCLDAQQGDEAYRSVAYATSNVCVVENLKDGKQGFLSGHLNAISTILVTEDKSCIITTELGPGSTIILWDTLSLKPSRIFNSPFEAGVLALDISGDKKYLVALSSPKQQQEVFDIFEKDGESEPSFIQALGIWDLQDHSRRTPVALIDVRVNSTLKIVKFNNLFAPYCELLCQGQNSVVFWDFFPPQKRGISNDSQPAKRVSLAGFASSKLKRAVNGIKGQLTHTLPLIPTSFKSHVARSYTSSSFLGLPHTAVTGNLHGNLIVWTVEDESWRASTYHTPKEKTAINVITPHGNTHFAIGLADGSISFYDLDFRIKLWFNSLNSGAIKSISFGSSNMLELEQEKTSKYALKFSSSVKKSSYGYFVASTSTGNILEFQPLEVESSSSPSAAYSWRVASSQKFQSAILELTCNPQRPELAVCENNEYLKVWNFKDEVMILERDYDDGIQPVSLAYSPCGEYLAVGFSNGMLKVLHTLADYEELWSSSYSEGSIIQIKFSEDSEDMAALSKHQIVYLFRKIRIISVNREPYTTWQILGKTSEDHINGSLTNLVAAFFVKASDEGPNHFFTLNEDNFLVEHEASSTVGLRPKMCTLRKLQSTLLSSLAKPSAAILIEGSRFTHTKNGVSVDQEKFKVAEVRARSLLVAYSDSKIRLWNLEDGSCWKTAILPFVESPITSFKLWRQPGNEKDYLLYACKEKYIGVAQLPFDGDPTKVVAIRAHTSDIACISLSHENHLLFTCEKEASCILQWEVNLGMNRMGLYRSSQRKSDENFIKKYICSVLKDEEAANPHYKKEIYRWIDVFNAIQLQSSNNENEDQSPHWLVGKLCLNDVHTMMCALGFYPLHEEAENIYSELIHKKRKELLRDEEEEDIIATEGGGSSEFNTKKPVFTFEDLIEVYLNHRPYRYVKEEMAEFNIAKDEEGG